MTFSPARIVRGDRVAVDQVPLPIYTPASKKPPAAEIKLLRSGSGIEGVEIHCRCGEVIRLRIEYLS